MKKFLSSYPELVKEWHPTKNGDLKPEDFTLGSIKKVWWLCPEGHEYLSVIGNRAKKNKPTGCPYCSGNRVSELNNITNNSSELLATWDWKNNDLNPDDVAVSGYQDIAWLCNHCEYRWITKPAWRRTTIITGKWRYTGCPNCSTSGFHTEFPAHVYLISIRNLNDDILFYKLGITNRSPIDERIPEIERSFMKIKRFSDARIYVEEIIHYENGRDAKDLENSLKIVSEIRLHISEKFTGSTELFIVNPLEYAREIGIID